MLKLKNVQLIRNLRVGVSKTANRNVSNNYGTRSTKASNSLVSIGIHGYSLLVIPVAAFGLGTWQIYRREWKLSLIDNLAKKTSAPPLEIPQNLEDILDKEYQKFEMVGKFEHEKEIYVGPRGLVEDVPSGSGLISSGQSGFHVITPFKLSDSDTTVLVNRGWVPRKRMNPSTRAKGQIDEEIRLVGIYRSPENRPQFIPKNQSQSKMFHYRDVESMARLLNTAPVFFDAASESTQPDGPIGGQTVVSVRNEHMSYILTWYSLAIITSYLWYRRLVKKLPLM